MTLHVNRLLIIIIAGLLLALVGMYEAAGNPRFSTGPTAENALAADQELAKALQNNDTLGIYRMLDKDWAVISTHGGVAEGPSVFPNGIKSGYLTRKTLELSEPKVSLVRRCRGGDDKGQNVRHVPRQILRRDGAPNGCLALGARGMEMHFDPRIKSARVE